MKFYKSVSVKKDLADETVETFYLFGWSKEKAETEGENGALCRLLFVRDTAVPHYDALLNLEASYRRAEAEEHGLFETLQQKTKRPSKAVAFALGVLLIFPGIVYYIKANRNFNAACEKKFNAEQKLEALGRRKWELKHEAQRLSGVQSEQA